MTVYGYVLMGGVTLQVVACLMSGDNTSTLLQATIGCLGVVLMVAGFHYLTTR